MLELGAREAELEIAQLFRERGGSSGGRRFLFARCVKRRQRRQQRAQRRVGGLREVVVVCVFWVVGQDSDFDLWAARVAVASVKLGVGS